MEEDPESDLELDMEGVIGNNCLFNTQAPAAYIFLRLVSTCLDKF